MRIEGRKFLGVLCAGLLALVGLTGCPQSKTRFVNVEKAVVEQTETQKGVSETKVVKVIQRADMNVIENSASVKSVSRITNNKPREKSKSGKQVFFDKFDISPDGEKLLIPMYEYSGTKWYSQIWTLGTNGVGLTRLTTGTYLDLFPVYTPDGKYVYFSSDRGEKESKIWRVFATGTGGLTRVTSSQQTDIAPSVAPNGQQLAYTVYMQEAPEPQIWTVNVNGSLPTQLVVGSFPIFSPDGKKLLFQRYSSDTKRWDIWTMNADGSARTQLTTGDADYRNPRWSPDGTKIVFDSNKGMDEDKRYNEDIWIMNGDGSNLTQLTTNGSSDEWPVFDPNGKYIYFKSNRGGSLEIWRMELAM